jgi:hypothetical protein
MEQQPERSVAVFLGDNIYPLGLPDTAADDRAEMERRLMEQIDAVLESGGRGIFVPGNHDWIRGREGGWEAILRQERFVIERGAPDVVWLPSGGCPGPVSVDLGERVRVVAIDTQWWLNKHAKPKHPYSSCPADAKWEFTDSLRAEVRRAGDRHVVVAAHHPLATGGTHGGNFTVKDHIFPLTVAVKWLYLPLPIIGSAYPIARQSGIWKAEPADAGLHRDGPRRAPRTGLRGGARAQPAGDRRAGRAAREAHRGERRGVLRPHGPRPLH